MKGAISSFPESRFQAYHLTFSDCAFHEKLRFVLTEAEYENLSLNTLARKDIDRTFGWHERLLILKLVRAYNEMQRKQSDSSVGATPTAK